ARRRSACAGDLGKHTPVCTRDRGTVPRPDAGSFAKRDSPPLAPEDRRQHIAPGVRDETPSATAKLPCLLANRPEITWIQRSVMPPWELGRRTYVNRSIEVNLLSGRGDRGAEVPENVMNWSMYTADRGTHLKIVVVGLTAALLIAVIGISARE